MKFLDKVRSKLQQDASDHKKKIEFEELVAQKKDVIKFAFITSQSVDQTNKLGQIEEEHRYVALLNEMIIQNRDKQKSVLELEEMIQREKQDIQDNNKTHANSRGTIWQGDILKMSINTAPETFMRNLQTKMSSQLKGTLDLDDIEALGERFNILEDAFEAINTQLIKEEEIRENLQNRILELTGDRVITT